MSLDESVSCLDNYVSDLNSHTKSTLDIPVRSDGSEYKIRDLAVDQQGALAVVVSSIRDYCLGNVNVKNGMLRLTVAGVAGSGKSTWINTLVSQVRRLFNCNESIGVYGPTGSAAFNAAGETLNRAFRVPIYIETLAMKGKVAKFLLTKFARTICLVIDERSLVEANKLGCIQTYMSMCAHKGRNSEEDWGGIPIVILVGDDYQIPAIGFGAFYALQEAPHKAGKHDKAAELKCREIGYDEFRKFGKNVYYLSPNAKRVNKDQDQFRRILKGLRCEDGVDELLEEDIQRLLALDINHSSYSRSEREEIQATSMYLFATKEPRDTHNAMMLSKANLQGNPVARIKAKTTNNRGVETTMFKHFDNERNPSLVHICKTAKVALHGCNIAPQVGLYHSTLGVVEDIVYRESESPNRGDLPAYVLVNFGQYCGKELVSGRSTSIPITPVTVHCKFFCCTRIYMPLTLSFGRTVHTFQGQTVGPVADGRPPNSIQRIIVQPGTRKFEGNNVGLFYTTASRPTTIGTSDDKMSSAIYFDGPDFSRARITNLTKDRSGKMYIKARLRQEWVNYLKNNNTHVKVYSEQEKKDLFEWVTTQRYTVQDLDAIIEKNAGPTEGR